MDLLHKLFGLSLYHDDDDDDKFEEEEDEDDDYDFEEGDIYFDFDSSADKDQSALSTPKMHRILEINFDKQSMQLKISTDNNCSGGSAADQSPLARYLCANVDSCRLEKPFCANEGRLKCGNCMLVAYCSKQCQLQHWKLHCAICKHSELSSQVWRPGTLTTRRRQHLQQQYRSLPFSEYLFQCGIQLFGNTPAFDIMNWKDNELLLLLKTKAPSKKGGVNKTATIANFDQPITIMFAASGDIRSVVETLASVPAEYQQRIQIVLNDYSEIIMARNLVMLVALVLAGNDVIDAVIQLWYSIAMTPNQYQGFEELIEKYILGPLSSNDGDQFNETLKISNGLATVFAHDFKHPLDCLQAMLNTNWDLQLALEVRNSKMLHPSRAGFRDQLMLGMRDFHREAWDEYRSNGLFLPFGARSDQHCIPNNFIFHPEYAWVIPETGDPINAWPMEKVLLEFAVENQLPINDIYGCLYFYIQDRLAKMMATIHRVPVEFHLYCKNARQLVKNLKLEPNCPKFDRIDASNLSGQHHLSLDRILSDWTPLLNDTNPNSALITCFTNWSAEDANGAVVRDLMTFNNLYRKPEYKEDIMKMVTTGNDGLLRACTDYFPSFNEYFLVVEQLEECLSKFENGGCGGRTIERRSQHRVVPPRFYVPINSLQSQVLDIKNHELLYIATSLTLHSLNERYVEFGFKSANENWLVNKENKGNEKKKNKTKKNKKKSKNNKNY